jgi:hypothetical protein
MQRSVSKDFVFQSKGLISKAAFLEFVTKLVGAT